WNPPFVQSVVGGSAGGDGTDTKIVARVGSSKLTLEDYQTLVTLYVPPESRNQVDPMEIINAWIEQEIVYREAKRMGLEKKDTVRVALDQLKFAYGMNRKQLLTQAWLAEASKNITVPQGELMAYFDAHKEEFLYEVKVSQIVVADPGVASQIHQQLKGGADFRTLAEQHTLDPLKGEPSSYIPRGSGLLTLAMEDAVFALDPGEFTEPFITPQGLTMIFKLLDKRKVRNQIAFDEVASYLQAMLSNERAERSVLQKVDSLRNAAQSEIEIRVENLFY
ncbi:MAG: peptidyl-prolyl cis-trans isomerase, partial [candidate division WOR-3 bacterium]|nr:peptidyl-prolyl cis-trans isomerase [candidate division WOR-3 bacterium]